MLILSDLVDQNHAVWVFLHQQHTSKCNYSNLIQDNICRFYKKLRKSI